MRKQFYVLIPGLLLAAMLAVLPGRGQEDSKKAEDKATCGAKLEREMARVQAELEKHAAELQKRMNDGDLRQLIEHRAELTAQRALASSELRARMAELSAHAAEMAQQATRVAPEPPEPPDFNDIEIFTGGERGWLGVSIAEVTPEKVKELKLPGERGVLLTEVLPDSPAAKAGLKTNDVIIEFNGQRVEGAMQFQRLVRETPAGRTAQLAVWRDGRAQSVSVELGTFQGHVKRWDREGMPKVFDFHLEMPEMSGKFFAAVPAGPRLGIEAEDLSGQLGSYFGAPEGEGVLVKEVKPGTPADRAGLKAGDVIVKIDGNRVRTIGDLRNQMRAKHEQKSVAVAVIRKGAEVSLNVEVEQPKTPKAPKTLSHRAIT